MPRTRNPYPADFREQLVALVRNARSVESQARKCELCAATIHERVRQAVADDGGNPGTLNPKFRCMKSSHSVPPWQQSTKPMEGDKSATGRAPTGLLSTPIA